MDKNSIKKLTSSPICWLIAAVLLIIGIVVRFWPTATGGSGIEFLPGGETTPGTEEGLERAKQERLRIEQRAALLKRLEMFGSEVSLSLLRYERAVQMARNEFYANQPLATSEAAFKRARQEVDSIASTDGICGIKNLCTLIYVMSWDKFKGTNKTEEFLDPYLQRVQTPLGEALTYQKEALERFQNRLIEANGTLQRELMLKFGNMETFMQGLTTISLETMKSMMDALSGMRVQFQELGRKSAFVAVDAALTVALAKPSLSILTKVVARVGMRMLGKTVARVVASLAGSAVAVVADGPLPIGDIFALCVDAGCAALTAWDIYKVRKKMPEEIRANMNAAIDDMRNNMQATSHGHVERLYEEAMKMAQTVADDMDKKIRAQEAAL